MRTGWGTPPGRAGSGQFADREALRRFARGGPVLAGGEPADYPRAGAAHPLWRVDDIHLPTGAEVAGARSTPLGGRGEEAGPFPPARRLPCRRYQSGTVEGYENRCSETAQAGSVAAEDARNETASQKRAVAKTLRAVRRQQMADGVGFEPTRQFPAYTLSKRAPSTTRPPIQRSRDAAEDVDAFRAGSRIRIPSDRRVPRRRNGGQHHPRSKESAGSSRSAGGRSRAKTREMHVRPREARRRRPPVIRSAVPRVKERRPGNRPDAPAHVCLRVARRKVLSAGREGCVPTRSHHRLAFPGKGDAGRAWFDRRQHASPRSDARGPRPLARRWGDRGDPVSPTAGEARGAWKGHAVERNRCARFCG